MPAFPRYSQRLGALLPFALRPQGIIAEAAKGQNSALLSAFLSDGLDPSLASELPPSVLSLPPPLAFSLSLSLPLPSLSPCSQSRVTLLDRGKNRGRGRVIPALYFSSGDSTFLKCSLLAPPPPILTHFGLLTTLAYLNSPSFHPSRASMLAHVCANVTSIFHRRCLPVPGLLLGKHLRDSGAAATGPDAVDIEPNTKRHTEDPGITSECCRHMAACTYPHGTEARKPCTASARGVPTCVSVMSSDIISAVLVQFHHRTVRSIKG